MPHEVPECPWQIVATDLFSWFGQYFLTIYDYYSRYFEEYPLRNTLAFTVTSYIKVAFSRHVIPKHLVYDNGPEYSCDEFAKFSDQYGFIYATSSPTHAQSMVSPKKRYQPLNTYLVNIKLTIKTLIFGILE